MGRYKIIKDNWVNGAQMIIKDFDSIAEDKEYFKVNKLSNLDSYIADEETKKEIRVKPTD